MAADNSSTGCKAHAQSKSGPGDTRTPVPAGESGAGRCRGRPRNPPAVVEGDTPEQAAVLPILSKMQMNQLLQLCRNINVDCK